MEQVLRKFNIEFCKEESRLDNNIQDIPTRIDVLNAKKGIEKEKKKKLGFWNKSSLKKFQIQINLANYNFGYECYLDGKLF